MIIVGVVVLVVLALAVGAELDSEGQRRLRHQVAEERRRLRAARPLRHGEGLCDRCPYRQRGPQG